MPSSITTIRWRMRVFLQANRAHTYLGLREKEYHVSGDLKDIYPDFVMMANAFGVKAKRVCKPEELRPAIQVTSWLHLQLNRVQKKYSPLHC